MRGTKRSTNEQATKRSMYVARAFLPEFRVDQFLHSDNPRCQSRILSAAED